MKKYLIALTFVLMTQLLSAQQEDCACWPYPFEEECASYCTGVFQKMSMDITLYLQAIDTLSENEQLQIKGLRASLSEITANLAPLEYGSKLSSKEEKALSKQIAMVETVLKEEQYIQAILESDFSGEYKNYAEEFNFTDEEGYRN